MIECMIATIYMCRAEILAKVVLALYYVFHTVRDRMHRELTILQKLPSPCRAELLRVSSPTNHSNTSAHRANGGREKEAVMEDREREREREREIEREREMSSL